MCQRKWWGYYISGGGRQARAVGNMKGKIALITGGAAGIGRAITERLAKRGAKIAILDIDARKGEEFASELNSKHGKDSAIYARCDVTDRKSFKECFDKTKSSLGNPNVLVNNAGIWDDSPSGWERQVNINFKGPINGSLLALEYMGKKNGGAGGAVLNTSSVLGLLASPIMPIYSGTKAGVLLFTRCFGTEFHYKLNGVRFVAICPHATGGSALFDNLDKCFSIPGPEMVDLYKSGVSDGDYQTIDAVADAAVHVLEKGKNGSVWTVGQNKGPEEFQFKDAQLVLSGSTNI
ncbi:15-hydroxyprostaglandin dehydrogenase [NAD(+)] [Halyomorpha halys]|uniref:15-hydroxyprostaglandin dehydrogenase [NAD(+)] n=1 Tax=Halyomorpha halys TaxID=286706 RepID=UPI0034D23762